MRLIKKMICLSQNKSRTHKMMNLTRLSHTYSLNETRFM